MRNAPRRHLISSLVAVLALVCTSTHAQTHSFLWKATKNGGTVYLAGSVHVLSEAYYPLAPAFDTAFTSADLLVEEIDLGEMAAPQSQMQMLTRGMLPSGQSLDGVLSPETFQAVSAKCSELG